jgi:hypothetical protein
MQTHTEGITHFLKHYLVQALYRYYFGCNYAIEHASLFIIHWHTMQGN